MKRSKTDLQDVIEWLEESWYEKTLEFNLEDRHSTRRDKIEEEFYFDQLDKKGFNEEEANKIMRELGYDY